MPLYKKLLTLLVLGVVVAFVVAAIRIVVRDRQSLDGHTVIIQTPSGRQSGHRKYDRSRYGSGKKWQNYPNTNRPQLRDVEINSADSLKLLTIRGVGPVFAGRIIDYRRRTGGFYRVEQLLEIRGVDSVKFLQIKPQIIVDKGFIRRCKIEMLTPLEIQENPILGKSLKRRLLKNRGLTLGQLYGAKIVLPQEKELLEVYFE